MYKDMFFMRIWILVSFLLITSLQTFSQQSVKVGAECMDDYIPYITNKRVAIVANQTSMVKDVHLVDTLVSLGINIKKIFSPEHGFRGTADAGEHLQNTIDSITNIPIISLYGNNKKPSAQDLSDVDIVIFDIQDVGARFYTYISTMHYVMEACAEHSVECMVFDRPNPNGFYVDGPILEPEFTSFVGMHPVPIVHGMTVAEYANMINGEGWLKNGIQCKLLYVLCDGYDHTVRYTLPVPPSPNLPTMQAVYLYPTLCLFEGTAFSCGRGTDYPFQIVGAPNFTDTTFSFVPRSIPGASRNPRYKGEVCYGIDLRTRDMSNVGEEGIILDIIIDAYSGYANKTSFFKPFFYRLTGTKTVKQAIMQGVSTQEIKESWQTDLQKFMEIRKKYLLYPDF